MPTERSTKYRSAVLAYMRHARHATNAEIIAELRHTFPQVSATTVHRVTARLVERGELAVAPAASDNTMRFDANLATHDHFQCAHCDRLRDVVLPADMFRAIQAKLGDCKLNGQLTVQGTCARCLKEQGDVR